MQTPVKSRHQAHHPSPPRKPTPLPAPWDRIFSISTRLLVWGLFIALLYVLRSFFALIFLTFVFAYFQTRWVNHLMRYSKNRTTAVILIGSLFLSVILAVSLFLAPGVYQQAKSFSSQFSTYVARIDQGLLDLSKEHPILKNAFPQLRELENLPTGNYSLAQSPTAMALEQLLGITEEESNGKNHEKNINSMLDALTNLGSKALHFISTFFLALLFAFLIVLDLPQLSRSVRNLEYTKLGFIYQEAADNIFQFGKTLGQALEAQFMIACVNTLLTTLGIYFLGLGQHIAFLSVLVFLFSFIPVVGVFISSFPICLIALQLHGVNTMLLAILMIIIVHIIEGYILNPRIYGARMHINPVIVLIILTVGGKLFHVWGLILGVPICTYFFTQAIRYKDTPANLSPDKT